MACTGRTGLRPPNLPGLGPGPPAVQRWVPAGAGGPRDGAGHRQAAHRAGQLRQRLRRGDPGGRAAGRAGPILRLGSVVAKRRRTRLAQCVDANTMFTCVCIQNESHVKRACTMFVVSVDLGQTSPERTLAHFFVFVSALLPFCPFFVTLNS